MGNRVRRELRMANHARVELRESLYLLSPDGRGTVFALAEHSAYEACVNTVTPEHPDRQERTSNCRDTVLMDGDEPGALPCTEQAIVRVDFDPTPPNRPPDWGGALHLTATHPIELGCTIGSLRSFRIHDFDADGKVELELDAIGVSPIEDERDQSNLSMQTRTLAYYRDDLTPQLEEELATFGCDCTRDTEDEVTASRLRLADVNHDGHPDALFDEVTYQSSGSCGEDEIGWPHLDRNPNADECAGEVEHYRWLYDATSDSWPDPTPPDPN
jgi:hypothetical protein